MGDEHDRLADLLLQAQELVLQPGPVDRIDRPERLVHQHQRWIGRERAGDAHPLTLAAGQLARITSADLLGVEADQLEQLAYARRNPVDDPSRAASEPWRCSR